MLVNLIIIIVTGVETSVWTDNVMLTIISSSVTFALTAVLCFIIGFINGHVSRKCKKGGSGRSVDATAPPTISTTNQVYYEDVLPKEIRQKGKGLELKENEAYRIIQH